MTDKKYDVALSFAGENRRYAERLAELLRAGGYSVFYDEYELAELWGTNLHDYLLSVYKDQSNYCVMFLSEHYKQKMWTNHERKSAQAKALKENREYILPIRLDDTEIPGLLPTVAYLDSREMTIEAIYQVLVEKLSGTATNESTNATVQNDPDEVEVLPQNADACFQRATAYHRNGDHDRAIDAFNRAIELNSDFAEAYINRGLTYHTNGDFDRAIADYNKAIELGPNAIEVYINRAAAYKAEGDYDRAIEDCNTAIELNPIAAEAYTNRGQTYRLKGDFDRAIADYNKAIELNPKEAGAHYNRGLAYDNKGEVDRAITDYTKAIDLGLEDAGAYNNRGLAYDNKGEVDRAIADYNKAIELNPDYGAAHHNRGVIYLIREDYYGAIRDCTKAIKLNRNHDAAYYIRGIAYNTIGDYDLAIKDYSRVIELNPNGGAYFARAMARLHVQQWEQAGTDLENAKDAGLDIIADFQTSYGSVPDFERRIGVKLPEDLAAMLTPKR